MKSKPFIMGKLSNTAIGFALLCLASFVIFQSSVGAKSTSDLENIVLKNAQTLKSFELVTQKNSTFSNKDLKGQWSFLIFGYTNCPDVCPATLSEVDDLVEQIAPQPPIIDNTQYVFVTLDPKRDTPKELKEYLGYFNADYVGLTGEVEKIREFCQQMGINFSYVQMTKEEYAVNHSSAVILIDPEGRYFARFPAPHYSKDLGTWFKKIRQL